MSSASAVTSHAAALAAVAASSRADARARVASSVGAAPRSGARAPRARAAVRTRAASFSSGDAAPELVEGPRGEVYASADEALAYASRDDDDAFDDVGASQSGSGGYGARRTTRKKKGRKSSGYAQGTRGAASRSREYERGAGGAFGSRSENTAFFSQASGSFSSGYDVRTAREDRRRRGDDHLFECVGAEWRERERLAGPTRALQRAADRGDADGALHALRRLRDACDPLNGEATEATRSGALPLAFYNAALRACKRSRPPAHVEARRLLLEMRDDSATPGVAPDARTYHEVVAALARAHEWRLAERTFAEMRAAFPNHDPSVLVYTSLISAYGKGGQWEKANVAFETLRAAGTQVDTGVYNALLSAAVSAARYREAARVFERMPAEGVRRNVTTYNAVLTSLGRQRRLRDMESLRREMRAMNIEANETTFSVLITAHGNAGDCHRACALLDEACDTPWVYKSAVVFNSALGACVKAGEQALGKRVLRLMRSEGIHPTLVTYNTMLMGASAERDWEEVATVFRELLRSGQVPDAITLDCLCGIEKLQAAADARADAEAAARRAVGDSDDENDAVFENGVVQTPPVSHAAVSTDLGDLCERLREVVAEETERAANPARDAQARADGNLNLMGGGSSAAPRRGTYPGAPPPTRPGAALTYAYDALLRALHVSGRGEEVERAFAEMTDGARAAHGAHVQLAHRVARGAAAVAARGRRHGAHAGGGHRAGRHHLRRAYRRGRGDRAVGPRHRVAGAGAGGGAPALRG